MLIFMVSFNSSSCIVLLFSSHLQAPKTWSRSQKVSQLQRSNASKIFRQRQILNKRILLENLDNLLDTLQQIEQRTVLFRSGAVCVEDSSPALYTCSELFHLQQFIAMPFGSEYRLGIMSQWRLGARIDAGFWIYLVYGLTSLVHLIFCVVGAERG
jgi:hypothetical protein